MPAPTKPSSTSLPNPIYRSSGIKPPIAWTIAGSDSGGGAGIQADLKVLAAFGVHGCSVITALTAQNTLGVLRSEAVSEAMLQDQLNALQADLPPAVIKTGMLGAASTCNVIANHLNEHKPSHLVCDPVLKSTSGSNLLAPDALDILVNHIFPHVDVLTPNLPETEQLVGSDFKSTEEAAERILALGVHSVLIKGGHSDGPDSQDFWTDGKSSIQLSSPRLETPSTHGTGCVLASAIAASLASGKELPEAVIIAKTFLNQCLKSPSKLGNGHGPMVIEPFKNNSEDRPRIKTW